MTHFWLLTINMLIPYIEFFKYHTFAIDAHIVFGKKNCFLLVISMMKNEDVELSPPRQVELALCHSGMSVVGVLLSFSQTFKSEQIVQGRTTMALQA